jgi:hypothetical protein
LNLSSVKSTKIHRLHDHEGRQWSL